MLLQKRNLGSIELVFVGSGGFHQNSNLKRNVLDIPLKISFLKIFASAPCPAEGFQTGNSCFTSSYALS